MVVRMGVDLGTAFTKVAIRAGVDPVLVDWCEITGDVSETGRYVMPGFVCRTKDDEYCWQQRGAAEVLTNLKLSVIDNVAKDEAPLATLAYLALVIRYARAFLYRHPEIGRKLGTRTLRWELNIGCPTEPHEKPEVVGMFRRIAQTAWTLANGGDDLGASHVASVWKAQGADCGLEAEPGVVPEFVAQIAGYLQSSQVNEGLHALVDIGAATVDVATFNVVLTKKSDDSSRIPIFFSAVKPLGTHYLSLKRHSSLGIELTWDDSLPVDSSEEFANRHGRRVSDVEAVDREFEKDVACVVSAVVNSTRTNTHGDPGSRVWRDGLPVFVTGGGAACIVYRHALVRALEDLRRRMVSPGRFRFIELDPLGTRSLPLGSEGGRRASVAIGLTEDAESIARIVPHRDIERIRREERERVDHTALYED